MDRATGTETGRPDDLLSGLQRSEVPVESLRRALDAAGRSSTAQDDATALDLAVVRALTASPDPDTGLAGLGPDPLAALVDRSVARLRASSAGATEAASRKPVWDLLDLVRRPSVLRRIERAGIDDWAARLLAAVEASHLTVGPLFRERAERYGEKVLFQVERQGKANGVSWRRVASRVDRLARGLSALEESRDPAPVAILSENRPEMALVDLACLTSGLLDVMVPANCTETDVGYILRHSAARTVVVSGAEQLRKVLKNRGGLPELRHIVSFDPRESRETKVLSLAEVESRAELVPSSIIEQRSLAVRIDEPATIMYTSGTTGTPKGIRFSQRNLVFKRFARALALPEIGDRDVLVCFLPLFHTFGRFLEMLGCVFWGATYCFLEDSSVESLIGGMRRHRPTVFISVPKRWMQLHEAITQIADPLHATDGQLLAATREITGGRLAWGLSAAGYLDSDVFRFFRQQGIELLSGFGMTEATGGITMTPPGDYREDSLGRALPGIELKLAEDGELLIRGPYVMMGYVEPGDGQPSFDEQGWLHSGDLMEADPDGHIRLVDRKKEIYKNVKGQTIAPQRIENMFRDFESIDRVFLVGDHHEYNTLLIHPKPNYEALDFPSMAAEEVRDHFRSLVVSVNKFLAPFERVVDFAIIDRDLDAARGELTPKGTPRRQVVARNFSDVIRSLYRRTHLQVGGVQVTIPNWLFQTLGLTAQDIRVDGERIRFRSSGEGLTIGRHGEGPTRVGSCLYRHPPRPLDLGALLNTPRLWLGNEELVRFAPLELSQRERPGRAGGEIEREGRAEPYRVTEEDRQALERSTGENEWGLLDVDLAARVLAAPDPEDAVRAVALLKRIAARAEGSLIEAALLVLAHGAEVEADAVRRRAFQALLPIEKETRFLETLRRFVSKSPPVLDEESRRALCRCAFPDSGIDSFIELARETGLDESGDRETIELASSLLGFLSAYGAAHPASYRRLRALLVRMSSFAAHEEVRGEAARQAESLQAGFREWLGPSLLIAVDPETGEEYGWRDVVVFDEEVGEPDRERLLSALTDTALLREAVFLFSDSTLIRLSDLPPGGVWIRLLGSQHGKSVYRISIQTRVQGHHDVAVNLNHSLSPAQVREEIEWLILSADAGSGTPLVEDFGGYWPAQDLWSEEFIPGETLTRALARLARRADGEERLRQLWPFLAWAALSGYVDFWDRSGGRWEIADPTTMNVVVPIADYRSGVRIVSVSARRRHTGLAEMMRSFMEEFVAPTERRYPLLQGVVGWELIFSSVLEIVGEQRGLQLLRELSSREPVSPEHGMERALEDYVAAVEATGFRPRRLYSAIDRFRRWERLSSDATPQARARTLQELYETYGLSRLAPIYPEVRVRFFRDTVLRDCAAPLADGLEELIRRLRGRELVGDELIDAVSELRTKLEPGLDEDYFLARISLPHLRPEDAADFVSTRLGGEHQSEIVVALADLDGNPFQVRHALSPKEVGRLHQLFLAAKLDVRFRPEHRYLMAINDRSRIVGGIYYEIEEGGQSAHLEKIVVAERYRRKGVAGGLLHEFFNRLRAAGVRTVTTGFFRPEYFYAYGFRIERRYAGLVKSLEDGEHPAAGAARTGSATA